MGDVVSSKNDNDVVQQHNNIVRMAEGILVETRESIANKHVVSMPIAELATLGSTVSSLLPTFRTVIENTTVSTDGLYKLVNASVGDSLKVAKNGNNWGAIKTADGSSKLAQFQPMGVTTATTTTVMPIDPVTVMIAFALFSVEQKLDSIVDMQRRILSTLEREKESKIEANMETLLSILQAYKFSWDNALFVNNHHMNVLNIKNAEREHMLWYQKIVIDMLDSKKLIVSHTKVNKKLIELSKQFKYYRLSVYVYSMASFVEVLLSGDFKEERFRYVKDEIEKVSLVYRNTFDKCSAYLEEMGNVAIDTAVIKGLGTVSSSVGKLIEKVPVAKENQVDEFLQEKGLQMKKDARRIERGAVEDFAKISNPGISIFVEKLEELIRIYGHTKEIYFDDKTIYLVS